MALFSNKSHRRRELAPYLDDDWVAFLEPGIEVEGKMRIACGMVRLNCHFKGEINCEGMLVVAEQGEIEGNIQAKQISIGGKVKGSVRAAESLEIKQAGVVLGDVYTAKLFVHPAGYFDGTCHMPAPEPEKHPAPGVSPERRA
ncbi:MAG: polymer-forming cytoskeletal protein [Acidobacteriia bacterium]|nr:polymer-forming cytoskeletal protein [Terriglobia bacterium]